MAAATVGIYDEKSIAKECACAYRNEENKQQNEKWYEKLFRAFLA